MKNTALVAVSGGMDSATLLGLMMREYHVIPVTFQYGSKHDQWEQEARGKLLEFYGLNNRRVDINLSEAMRNFKSALLKSGPAIPEGHYTDESMSATVVPGRNIIFLSIMSGLAWSLGAQMIAIGAHRGDHAIYEDCCKEFMLSMATSLYLGTGGRVTLAAPFIDMDKGDIAILGRSLSVPYHLTRTCYKDQPLACGKCGSCVERLEAFAKAGMPDPIQYEATQEAK